MLHLGERLDGGHYTASNIDQDLLSVGNTFPTEEQAQKVAKKVKELFKSLQNFSQKYKIGITSLQILDASDVLYHFITQKVNPL